MSIESSQGRRDAGFEKGSGSRLWDIYMQPAFLICVVVLVVASSGMSIMIKSLGVRLEKEPLALKKSLELLDRKSLGAYKVVSQQRIENADVVESLGTDDYIQCYLEDTQASADSAVRYCSLFVTYYGLPDRVPHVPEECYMGSGYQQVASDSVTFVMPADSGREAVTGRYLVFNNSSESGWGGGREFGVFYLFNVNGIYANSREQARVILNKNLFGRHSYFSKVEWKFFSRGLEGVFYPKKKQAVAASEKLLGVILPILEQEHWPIQEWDQQERKEQ